MTLKKQMRRAIGCVMTALMLHGCAAASPARRDFCLIYTPVYTAQADTRETKRQTDGNNAAWQALCESAYAP